VNPCEQAYIHSDSDQCQVSVIPHEELISAKTMISNRRSSNDVYEILVQKSIHRHDRTFGGRSQFRFIVLEVELVLIPRSAFRISRYQSFYWMDLRSSQ
jgi:hypothetical protein